MREHGSTRPEPGPRRTGARAGLIVWCVLAVTVLAAGPPARRSTPARPPRPAPELARIRYWTAPDHTRLVFDLTGPPAGNPRYRLADSLTFEVYLPFTRKAAAVTTEFVGDSLVADIFPAVSDSGCAIRIRLQRPTTPLGFVLAAVDGNPDRL